MKKESYFLVSKRSQLELWCCELVLLNKSMFQSMKHIMFKKSGNKYEGCCPPPPLRGSPSQQAPPA